MILLNISKGKQDIKESVEQRHVWMLLAWLEIKQRYSRSKIGPFWLTLSMGVMVGALGIIYGALFKMSVRDYLPMLAVGLVMWSFISITLTEGCNTYVMSTGYIKQISLPKGIFIFQNLWRNLIILAHNFLIVLIVLLAFQINFLPTVHLFLLGMLLLIWNLWWSTTVLALICARFRDIPPIVISILQVIFYITPILFKRDMLNQYGWMIDFNPFAHLIEIVRSPLLGQAPSLLNWAVCLAMAVIGSVVCLFMHGRYRARIPYWV